mmetsp:Transcript_104691/g.207998  ORF Transcript_104691/g.207998 Transcript_104691/m.207998 type:complete len:170 (-) Transcript_104691:105-614(-)
MKPAWDQLMQDYDGVEGALVADVDCHGDGKDLCDEQNIEGFPTIKWGDPEALEDYEGEREYEDLKKFAEQKMKPACSPANFDLCDDAKKALIKKFRAMESMDLVDEVEKINEEIKTVTEDFDKKIEELQAAFEEMEKKKNEKLSEVKSKSGLSLMHAVLKEAGETKSEL